MKRLFCFIFIFLVIQIASQDYEVHYIWVQGLESVSEDTFMEIINFSLDELPRVVDRSEIIAMERALRESRYFRSYSIEHEYEYLIFNLKENPLLKEIEIAGNTLISTRRIRKAIKRTLRREKLDEFYSFYTASLIRQSVLGKYHRRKLFNVEINIKEIAEDNYVNLFVEIDEKDHYQIDKINIEGNEYFSDRRIRRHMQTKTAGFPRKRYFYSEILSQDIHQVIRLYHDHGYLEADISLELEFDEERKRVVINLLVEEGVQYRWESLEIFGNTLFTDSEIKKQLRQVEQEMFSYSLWKKRDASRIYDLYANEGFIDTLVETDFIRRDETVDLVLKIIEGKRYRVGEIQIFRPPLDLDDPGFWKRLGLLISPPVEEEVIRNYMRVQEGDIYKKHRVQRGFFNLVNSNLFEQVEFIGEPTPFQQETTDYLTSTIPGALGKESVRDPYVRDIQVQLEEKPTGMLMLSGGYGEDIGVFGQLQLTERNFRGKGHIFSLVGTFSSDYHSVYSSYHIPFFRGKQHQSLSTNAYSSVFRRYKYDESRRGIEFELGNKINDYLTWYWGMKFIQVGLDLDSNLEAGVDISDEMYQHMDIDFNKYILTGPSLGLREDTRDSYSFPTRGYVQHYRLDLYGAFGGEFLPDVSADYRWFYPLPGKLVWANNMNLATALRSIENVPLPERYYLGGLRTVRGYAFRGIIPKDKVNDEFNKDFPIGGTGRILFKTEIRRRFTQYFSMAGFLDSGVLGHDNIYDWQDPWKFGTGIQFAFHLPIGDISLDVAHALNPDKLDKRQTVHINMGFNF